MDMVVREAVAMNNDQEKDSYDESWCFWSHLFGNKCMLESIIDELTEVARQTNNILEYLVHAAFVLLRTRNKTL